MVAIKSHQANALIAAPDKRLTAFLVFGSDSGLVTERAQKLASALAAREAGEILRLDDTDLDGDPDRLAVELQTVPMFGGAKIIRASAGRRVNVNVLKPLLQGPAPPGALIVEAGNLKAEEALRQLFEKSDRAAAIACYPDESRDLGSLVDEVLGAAKLRIGLPAREALLARLGADRALSRSELEKLVLFAHGQGEVTADDVETIVGDASEQTLDRAVTAAASGDGARAVLECDRAVASGESAQTIILATQRYFLRLHRTRAQLDQGRSLDDALRAIRPPLHFKQKDIFSAQLRSWSSDRLSRALSGISRAAKAARLTSALEEPLAERLLMDLAKLARSQDAGGPRRN